MRQANPKAVAVAAALAEGAIKEVAPVAIQVAVPAVLEAVNRAENPVVNAIVAARLHVEKAAKRPHKTA